MGAGKGERKGWVSKSLSDLNLLQCWKRVGVQYSARSSPMQKICLTNDL